MRVFAASSGSIAAHITMPANPPHTTADIASASACIRPPGWLGPALEAASPGALPGSQLRSRRYVPKSAAGWQFG
jgi:hypothetical protein